MFTIKGTRLRNPGKRQTITLVGYAGSTLGVWSIRVLHGSRLTGNKRILTIIDCFGVRVSETEVDSVRHAASHGNRYALISARCCTFKNVDRTQLCNRALQWIDAGWERTIERSGKLFGGK